MLLTGKPSGLPEVYPYRVKLATVRSVHTLRRQLRSDDEKASRDAARSLIQFRVALGKRGRRTGKKPAPGAADAARIAAHLEGLTDAELDALIAELGPAGRGPAHPPGA
jgi:hypothetical protein